MDERERLARRIWCVLMHVHYQTKDRMSCRIGLTCEEVIEAHKLLFGRPDPDYPNDHVAYEDPADPHECEKYNKWSEELTKLKEKK